MREELADLLEVMLTLLKVHHITFEEIAQTAQEKKLRKGGFDDRIYVDIVEVKEGAQALSYYRAHADRYLELT
jgi:hypothetical protein